MINIFEERIMLENGIAKLVPLDRASALALASIAYDEDTWEHMETNVSDVDDLHRYIETALSERSGNETYPFIVYDKRVNKVAGCTRYGMADTLCQSLEIGWTWYGKAFRGTGLNLACKQLLLQYAFEAAGVNRISFSAAPDNLRSRKAITKIGGHFEGILREVFPAADGTLQDLATFSILKSEWPEIKESIFPAAE